MGKPQSYFGVDILKHVLAICVIIQHMHSSARYSEATNGRIAQVVVSVQGAVLVFFLISGYFFRVKREAGNSTTLSEHIHRHGKRLLIPFFLLSSINAIALLVMGKLTFPGIVREMATGHGVGMQLYFLPFLFLWTALAAGIQVAVAFSHRREVAILLPLAAILALTAIHFPTQSATGASYYLLPLYLLAFIVGRLIALAQEHSKDQVALIVGGMVLTFCALGLVDFRFYYIGAGVLAFAVARYLSSILPSRRGAGAGGVYLLHTPIVNFVVSVGLLRIGIAQWPNAILSVVCTYVLCLAFTLSVIKSLPGLRWLLLE